jgi:plasmid replication initiation protein
VSVNSLLYKNVVAQANLLTSAKDELNIDQRRILYMCLETIYQQGWPEDGLFTIKPKTYAEYFKISTHQARADIRSGLLLFHTANSDTGLSPGVTLTENEGEYTARTRFSWVGYTREVTDSVGRIRGDFSLGINPYLKPLLIPQALVLQTSFLQFDELKSLKSEYTLRIFENICRFRNSGEYFISHNQIMDRWPMPKSYAKNRALLKVNILDRAVSEIKEKSELVQNLTLYVKRGPRNRAESYLFQFDTF